MAVLTLASLLVLWLQPVDLAEGVSRHRDWPAVVFALLTTVPLLWRRQAPVTVAVITVLASLIGSFRGYALAFATVGALVGLASAAYFTDRWRTVWLGVFSLVALVAVSTIAQGSLLGLQPLVADMSAPLLALLAGDVMRTRRLYAERWQARAEEIERLRDAEQQHAVAQERVRLARDVHDIVGHYLAGIALQARAGLRRVRSDPERAIQALTEIDQLAGHALAETRQAVGIIRAEDGLADLRPAPSIRDVEDLIARVRTPETHVDFRCDQSTKTLPAALQTAAYRIVQESLNNVIKHAGPASAHVTIERAHRRPDRHRPATTGGPHRTLFGPGNGLRGMRERAEQAGGILAAGPDREGGWRVRATFPLATADRA